MSGPRTTVETVVIGAGHAGLIASWHLRQAGREHVGVAMDAEYLVPYWT